MLFRSRRLGFGVLGICLSLTLVAAWFNRAAGDGEGQTTAAIKGWKKGVGWGWIWGKEDELGALNAMTPETTRAALQLATQGRTYDLGIPYSRNSYKWPGHNPCEVMSFRTPEGVKRQADHPFTAPAVNPSGQGWHSCALFVSDNVGTQIDGLAHVTVGEDHHWYNGFREADWGGNFGVRKCDAVSIPPIIARGVLLDIAGLRNVDALPKSYAISPKDIDEAVRAQGIALRPGDVVLIRTGALRHWGKDGADAERLREFDSAGITLDTAKYLVEKFGAMMVCSDTSGLEVNPAPSGSDSFIPVHKYLLIDQGVHIGEFHYLEELARDRVYEFCYMGVTNKIVGTTAGFTLRPVGIK
jgi:kynurenine formamidase